MNKKLISEKNPQGVEYPEAVTADGKLVSAIDVEKGSDAWEGVKFYFPGCEGDEKEEMEFISRKHKNGVTKFFRHKKGYIGDRNEPDRYLHNYAELRFKQRFDDSLASGKFPVQYYVIEKCPECSSCKLKRDLKCNGEPKPVLKTMNLRELYDTCSIEKGADKYIADLLLSNSHDESIKPMFLEVFVTHKCTEEKIASGYPIIEIKINQKEDADNAIIENAGEVVDDYLFMKSENRKALPPIVFYGFKRDALFNNYKQYLNFTLTKHENKLIADCRAITCKEVESFAPEKRAFSLSVPVDELNDIDIYEIGMAKAQDLGLKVRDCSLCGRYKIPYRNGKGIGSNSCFLRHRVLTTKDNQGQDIQIQNPYIFQLPYRCDGFDKSKRALGCNLYFLDRPRISKLVRSLDNMHKILWVDESLLPPKPKPIEQRPPVKHVIEKLQPPKPEPSQVQNEVTLEEEFEPTNTKTYEKGKKLLTFEECSSCPIYRPQCGHCLGDEEKDGRRYVVCDYQRPGLVKQIPAVDIFKENPEPVPF